jgi:hypothetical protein
VHPPFVAAPQGSVQATTDLGRLTNRIKIKKENKNISFL